MKKENKSFNFGTHRDGDLISVEKTNPHENPEMGNNGGGYPHRKFVLKSKDITAIVEDSCCGDFGDRYNITFKKGDVVKKFFFDEVQRETIQNVPYWDIKDFTEFAWEISS